MLKIIIIKPLRYARFFLFYSPILFKWFSLSHTPLFPVSSSTPCEPLSATEEFSLIKEVVDQFVDDHSDFCGAKVIFSGSKVFGIFSLFR